jgi:hypothetical protein
MVGSQLSTAGFLLLGSYSGFVSPNALVFDIVEFEHRALVGDTAQNSFPSTINPGPCHTTSHMSFEFQLDSIRHNRGCGMTWAVSILVPGSSRRYQLDTQEPSRTLQPPTASITNRQRSIRDMCWADGCVVLGPGHVSVNGRLCESNSCIEIDARFVTQSP